ncbi:MAG TPA: hypothetical protein VMC42_00575 [Methanoregulaceae archaeon]|jgi:hypothetical protein|nr:hypothetical protein [Methanoregulaceae archaeon]
METHTSVWNRPLTCEQVRIWIALCIVFLFGYLCGFIVCLGWWIR